MIAPCTCPKHTVNGHVVRAYLNVKCKAHGERPDMKHCATCTCNQAAKGEAMTSHPSVQSGEAK